MNKTSVLTVVLLFSLLIFTVRTRTVLADVSGVNFNVYFAQNSCLVFQNNPSENVSLTVNSGSLNSSVTSIRIYDGGGYFTFNNTANATITVDFTVTSLQVWGDQDNETRNVQSGDIISIDSGDSVVLSWTIHLQPWLPIMFIFGMIGIVSMFYGGLNFISEMQKKHYYKAFIVTTIAVSIGVAFVLAWLWS